jgi:ribonucleoside-diphosphate reductase alpha chain
MGCGEIPLLPYESCNLGHINLSKFVHNGIFDWKGFKDIIPDCIRFLDNVIDVNKYPLDEIESMNKNTRRIGLGVLGFSHALILMNIRYGSDESLEFARELSNVLHEESIKASELLGEEKGYYGWWQDGLPNRRNVTVNTIAPTGATSLIAETSSSIEPIFSFVYKKTVWNDIDKSGSIYIVEPILEYIITENGLNRDEVIEYMERTGKPHHSIPKKYKDVMITANEISWRDHIEMQSVWQKNIDSSISKTINLPNDATESDVSNAFIEAWQSGCKSITVYRNGSRKIEGLSKETNDSNERPRTLRGITFKGRSGCGNIYATINGNGEPYECFLHSSGGCEANNEAIGRLISLCKRHNIDTSEIVKQLKTVKCATAMSSKKSEGKSCAFIIGRFLEQYSGGTEEIVNICPECGERLNFGEGCSKGTCKNCGWSGCS